jgi:hypothetical protein
VGALSGKDIIIAGDIHGNFGQLNTLINKKKPKIVVCCGDFGYWPGHVEIDIKNKDTIILFCDGNHENHWALRKLENTEIIPGVFYMPRGSTYTLPNGKRVLFMGGAESIDRYVRKMGVSWFPEETITQSDFQNLPAGKIDILISHTCPTELVSTILGPDTWMANDPSTIALSNLWDMYKPKQWFFGHWHCFKQGILHGITEWTCLSGTGMNDKWWTYL